MNDPIPEKTVQYHLRNSVVLVGLMGAGKSTIGRRLAGEIGVNFTDSDEAIAEAAECSISDIFAIYGEQKFRDLEKRVILRLVSGTPHVIATGGGAFVNSEIRTAILAASTTIWLRADTKVLLARVSRRDTRPLLAKGDKKEILERLMEEREPFYAQAHFAIDNNAGCHEKVVSNMMDILKENRVIMYE